MMWRKNIKDPQGRQALLALAVMAEGVRALVWALQI
jgi:hypothetical protein